MKEKITYLKKKWFSFWEEENLPTLKHGANFHFVIRLSFMVFIFAILNFSITALTKSLPYSLYKESSILGAVFQHIFTTYRVFFLLPFFALFFFGKSLWENWTSLNDYKPLRFLILISAVLLAWTYSTYDTNLFFNQIHLIDRIALLLLIPLMWWKPIFTIPFLYVSFFIINQFAVLRGFSWAIPFLSIHLIMGFAAYFIFKILTTTQHIKDAFFLLSCLLVGHYWHSGWMKLSSGWVLMDQIQYLLPGTYPNGWLGFMPVDFIEKNTNILASIAGPFRFLVVLTEVGCIFFLLNKKFARLFLVAFILFHIGVFLSSGIFFWMWILIDLVFLFFLLKKNTLTALFSFNKYQLLFAFVIIISSKFWGKSVTLFWHSVPVTYTYILEANCQDGKTYKLPPNFFAPYDYQFTLSSFGFLNPNPILPIAWGASNKETATLLNSIENIAQIESLEKSNGRIQFNQVKTNNFTFFLQTYLQNWNSKLSKDNLFSPFKSPRYLWTFPSKTFPNSPKIINNVTIHELATVFHQGKYIEFRKRLVKEIKIN